MDNENYKKDTAKGKIILFAIGTLLGAVIASAAFLICVNTLGVNNNSAQSSQQMPGGTPPEMPSGQSGSSSQDTPPEMPSGQNNSGNENSGNSQNNNQDQSTNQSNTNS